MSVCATWQTSPVKTWNDMLAKPFAVGGEGLGSDPDTFARADAQVFGVKLKLITGYPGTSDMNLAVERGEVDGRCGWSWSSIKSTRPDWLTEKKLNVLVQIGAGEAPRARGRAAINEFANDRQKQILKLVLSRLMVGRPFAAPPGVPDDRKQALRQAFDETLKDPAFLEEANKQKLEVNPVSGAEVDKLIGELYRTPKDIIEEARAAIAP